MIVSTEFTEYVIEYSIYHIITYDKKIYMIDYSIYITIISIYGLTSIVMKEKMTSQLFRRNI